MIFCWDRVIIERHAPMRNRNSKLEREKINPEIFSNHDNH